MPRNRFNPGQAIQRAWRTMTRPFSRQPIGPKGTSPLHRTWKDLTRSIRRKPISQPKSPSLQTRTEQLLRRVNRPYTETASDWVALPTETRVTASVLLNLAGYAFLISSLLDYVLFLFPLQPTNLLWEFRTMEQLVSHSWALLLGLFLICVRQQPAIRRGELRFLVALSWFALLIGLLFLLMLPLGVRNTLRIDGIQKNQFVNQSKAVDTQFQSITQVVNRGLTQPPAKVQLQELAIRLRSPAFLEARSKEEVLKIIEQSRATSQKQLGDNRKAQQLDLLKKSARINVGSLLAGSFFIALWWSTRWTREALRQRGETGTGSAPKKQSGQVLESTDILDQPSSMRDEDVQNGPQ